MLVDFGEKVFERNPNLVEDFQALVERNTKMRDTNLNLAERNRKWLVLP